MREVEGEVIMSLKDFPPFYTLQPNLETRSKQLSIWKDYILDFSRSNRKFTLDYDIFSNPSINRNCNSEFINMIIQELIKSGKIKN